jgi:hypothetical protein
MAKILTALFLIVFFAPGAFAQPRIGISGNVNWETMLLTADVSLDMASAGLRLPSGRTRGESLISAGYTDLIRANIMSIQVDSSSTIADLVARGELTPTDIEAIASRAVSVPPSMQPDMRSLSSSYTISLSQISSSLLRHVNPAPGARTLNPISAARYTGIIIIASESLPIHGMRSSALAIPCLFPKIWDSEMNLIYDRNMLIVRENPVIHYASSRDIFANNPSGLSPRLREVAGDRPLRIFATGVFGIRSTDLIIDRSDALLIISSEENRRLLSEGRVVIVLDDSVLTYNFER